MPLSQRRDEYPLYHKGVSSPILRALLEGSCLVFTNGEISAVGFASTQFNIRSGMARVRQTLLSKTSELKKSVDRDATDIPNPRSLIYAQNLLKQTDHEVVYQVIQEARHEFNYLLLSTGLCENIGLIDFSRIYL